MTKPTKRALFAAAVLAVCCGCRAFPKTHYSEPMEEPGVVSDKVFVPSGHGSGVSPGISMSGKMVMTFNDIDIPARYAVVFRCAHGGFAVQRDGKRLFEKLAEGDSVRIVYRIVYRDSTAVDLDFIDAIPLPAAPRKESADHE